MEGIYILFSIFMHFNPYGGFLFYLSMGEKVEMLRKNRIYVLILILMGVAVFAACTSAGIVFQRRLAKNENAEGDKVIQLKLAHFFPATHPVEADLLNKWSEEVEQATDGRIKIVRYPGETLLKANDIYQGVMDGVADIGMSCFSYTRGRFPVLEVFELPGVIYKSAEAASKTAWEGIKKTQPEEIQDTRLLMVLATGSGDLFTKTPVRNLNDLQGMEIRATGLSAKTLDTLGATPIAMAQSEAYEAMSKGMVEGNLSPLEVLKGWKHAEVTNYVTKTPFLYNTLFFLTMNLDKWNSLPPDLQKAVEDVSEKCFQEIGAGLWDRQNEDALNWAVNEMGMEILELSEQEMLLWINKVEPIQSEYVEKLKKRGLNGKEILDMAKQLADKYNDGW